MSLCDYSKNAFGFVVLADRISTLASPASSEVFPVVVSIRLFYLKSINMIERVAIEVHKVVP